MRTAKLILVVMSFGFSAVLGQEPAAEVVQLRAEVARLQAENAKLAKQVEDYGASLKQLSEGTAAQEKLAGRWVIESARLNGQVVAADQGGELEFVGNVVLAKMPGRAEPLRHLFQVYDPEKQLLFRPVISLVETYKTSGTSFDRMNGRYQLDGDTLRVSLESGYTIPKEISDKNQVLWVLKRKKS